MIRDSEHLFHTLRIPMAAGLQCARRSLQDTPLQDGRMATGSVGSGSAYYLSATCTPTSRGSLISRSRECVWLPHAQPIPILMISVSSSGAARCQHTESAEKSGLLTLLSWLPTVSAGDWCQRTVARISRRGGHLMIHALAAVRPLIQWLTFLSCAGRQSRRRMEAFSTQQRRMRS